MQTILGIQTLGFNGHSAIGIRLYSISRAEIILGTFLTSGYISGYCLFIFDDRVDKNESYSGPCNAAIVF